MLCCGQVKNDVKLIADTSASMATKKTEWKARSQLRTGEIAAISQAVSILTSDDAKDTTQHHTKRQYAYIYIYIYTHIHTICAASL